MSAIQKFPKYRVAAVQAGPIVKDVPQWFDLEATMDKATNLIAEAGENGARLIVFPECFIPCFPYWSVDFTDMDGFNEIWANFLWSSVEIPSGETEILCAAAKSAGAYVAVGINERDKIFPGRMYNSVLYLSPRGEILGTHRKICPTRTERLFHTPGDGGDNLKTVYNTDIGVLGGSICGEHHQPLLMYNWLMQGIQVHCSLWPGIAGVGGHSTRHVFVVHSHMYITEKDMPKNFYKNCRFNIPGVICGGSGIIHPSGKYITGPVYNEETIVYADIDLSDIDRTGIATNLTGLYSRWDLLNLNVRQEKYEPLMPMQVSHSDPLNSQSDRIRELETRIEQLEQTIAQLSSEEESRGKK